MYDSRSQNLNWMTGEHADFTAIGKPIPNLGNLTALGEPGPNNGERLQPTTISAASHVDFRRDEMAK